MYQAVNPASEEPMQAYEEHSDQQVTAIIEKAEKAFQFWKNTAFKDRAACMKRAAEILRVRKDALSRTMTEEMGKTLTESQGEIEKCAWVCDYYADHAATFLANEEIVTDATKSYVSYQPLGVILAIMPWNYPFWQVFRFAAPGLMAGNASILKHAPNVPGCALAIESVFSEAGFPKGLFANLFLTNEQAATVIANRKIKAVTLTGSTRAGREVAEKAGAELKKCVLELGGSDPYVVLEDADLELAVKKMAAGRLKNAGQSCIAAKRFIVPNAIKDSFLEKLKEEMESYSFGDPILEGTDMGPMVGKKYRDQLHEQVQQSLQAGAKCILGGQIPKGRGYYYPPTILTNVSKGMPAYDEELFGPVASVISVKDEEEAFRIANDTNYGLGAAIFSKDVARAQVLAETRLDAGSCFVNTMVQSDPRLPFGGIKDSGFGRELSHHGIKEFVNVKTVQVG